MNRILATTLATLLSLFALGFNAHAAQDSLTRITRQWTGDLPELLKRKAPIRVLVSFDRTNFFVVKGRMRGMEYDLMKAYEEYLGKHHGKEHVRMVFIAVPFEELIPALLDGRGDIAAAGLTVTPGRKQKVAFAAPYRTGVSEIVVGSPKARPITKLDDLAGQTVHVMAGSSYVGRLKSLNHDFKRRGMKLVDIVEADPNLVAEDLLEMAERNIIRYTVVDSHEAELWKSALPKLRLFSEAPLHTDGALAWAVRPDSPKLAKSLSDYAATVRQGTLMGNMVFKRYYVNTDWVKNPLDETAVQELSPLVKLFQKYAKEYDFDWLKIAAQAYQESGLDMDKKSSMGAVGVMQIKPSTAADPNIGIDDVTTPAGNIQAGVKYLRFLRDTYFQDVHPDAEVDFALAAYNAGPSRVRDLQKRAADMGLDPDRWFGNVEWAAFDAIGPETPNYVANVQMYYAAYKSMFQVLTERERAK